MSNFRPLLRRLTSGRGRPANPAIEEPRFYSRFGGLWTDRSDVEQQIEYRLHHGLIKDSEADLLRQWCRQGYVILPQAVDQAVCDRVRDDIERSWRTGEDRLFIFPPGSPTPLPLTANAPTDGMRVVDIYAFFESAREALFSEPISRFLQIVFDDAPVLFQSLSFEKGSQQGMHQDTAYVVVNSPLELAASWIALQDVTEGSGELMYYEGSHRLPEYSFSGEFKHWNPERDGAEQHTEWSHLIHDHAAAMGLRHVTFLPKKGDALIWSADLAHGGSPNPDPDATRKSLVGHYCPDRCEPHYFSFKPDQRTKVAWGGGFYSSAHYPL